MHSLVSSLVYPVAWFKHAGMPYRVHFSVNEQSHFASLQAVYCTDCPTELLSVFCEILPAWEPPCPDATHPRTPLELWQNVLYASKGTPWEKKFNDEFLLWQEKEFDNAMIK